MNRVWEYDPATEAKLSMEAYSASDGSSHGSPLGIESLVNLQVTKWLKESAPAANVFSRGGRPWDREPYIVSNPQYGFNSVGGGQEIINPSTPLPSPPVPTPWLTQVSPNSTPSGLTQQIAPLSLEEAGPLPTWTTSYNSKNKYLCPCCVNIPTAWHGAIDYPTWLNT